VSVGGIQKKEQSIRKTTGDSGFHQVVLTWVRKNTKKRGTKMKKASFA